MAIDLADYERKAREAIQAFWGNREKARQKQIESGKADQGERAGSCRHPSAAPCADIAGLFSPHEVVGPSGYQ